MGDNWLLLTFRESRGQTGRSLLDMPTFKKLIDSALKESAAVAQSAPAK